MLKRDMRTHNPYIALILGSFIFALVFSSVEVNVLVLTTYLLPLGSLATKHLFKCLLRIASTSGNLGCSKACLKVRVSAEGKEIVRYETSALQMGRSTYI